jgi:hypothetical protein
LSSGEGETVAIAFGGSVVLDKAVEDVWRFLTDPDRDTNWRRPHALDPPVLLAWKQVNSGTFVTDGSYRLESANGGTRFTLALSGEGKGPSNCWRTDSPVTRTGR